MFYNRGPGGCSHQHIPVIAEDVWKDDLGGAHAVAVHRVGVAAQTIEEAMNLTLRVVKAPGAGPPIGATVDRLRPMPLDDAAQFGGKQVRRSFPAYRNKRFLTSLGAWPCPIIEPPGPHHRLANARRMPDAVWNVG